MLTLKTTEVPESDGQLLDGQLLRVCSVSPDPCGLANYKNFTNTYIHVQYTYSTAL